MDICEFSSRGNSHSESPTQLSSSNSAGYHIVVVLWNNDVIR